MNSPKYVNAYNLHFQSELADELMETVHTIYLQLWWLFKTWGIIDRWWGYALWWKSSSISDQPIFNIGEFWLYIMLSLNITARIDALQQHIWKRSYKVHVRIWNIVFFELKVILHPAHISPWTSWYTNQKTNTAQDVFIVLKSIEIHFWLDPHIWVCLYWLVNHCITFFLIGVNWNMH